MVALAVGDTLFLIPNVLKQTPETLAGRSLYTSAPLLNTLICTCMNTVGFGWCLMASFLVAVDRFVVFLAPDWARLVFGNRTRMMLIAVVFPAGFGSKFMTTVASYITFQFSSPR